MRFASRPDADRLKRPPRVAWTLAGLLAAMAILVAVAPVFTGTSIANRTALSKFKMRRLSIAWQTYSADHNDHSCPAENWNHILRNQVGSEHGQQQSDPLHDPLLENEDQKLGYALNPGMCQIDATKLEDPTKYILFGLTSTPGKDALLTPESLRKISSYPPAPSSATPTVTPEKPSLTRLSTCTGNSPENYS